MTQQGLQSLFPGKFKQLIINFDLILYDVIFIVVGCSIASTSILIQLLLDQLLTILVDTGQSLRIDYPQKHLLAFHSALSIPSSQIFLGFEDHLIFFCFEMGYALLDLHGSPVVLQQFLVIQ